MSKILLLHWAQNVRHHCWLVQNAFWDTWLSQVHVDSELEQRTRTEEQTGAQLEKDLMSFVILQTLDIFSSL